MKQELSNQLSDMCESYSISPGIECMILELMYDAYHNGWEDGIREQADSEMPL
jgi:hypothetical protein